MAIVGINDSNEAVRPWVLLTLAYAAYVAICIILLHSTAAEIVRLWAGSSSWHHGFAVAPLCLWMVFDRRHDAPAPSPNLFAVGIVAAAAFVWLVGRANEIALIEHLAFVGLLIAGVPFMFGVRVLRYFGFPAAFLFFMAPFGEVIVPVLQTITSVGTSVILGLVGFDPIRNGILIELPAKSFRVAESCAGLNLLLASILTSAFVAYNWLRDSRQMIVFIASAAACAIAINIIRVFIIIALASIGGWDWNIADDHQVVGLILYALMVAGIVVVGQRLADRQKRSGKIH